MEMLDCQPTMLKICDFGDGSLKTPDVEIFLQ
jgi:hypothetical protein